MNYQEIRPQAPLSRYVECFWSLRGNATTAAPISQSIYPDGCMELIFHCADSFNRYSSRGMWELQPRQFLVGQMKRPVLLQPTGRVDVLGIRFQPAGAYLFLTIPTRDLMGRFVRLDELENPIFRELGVRIWDAATVSERISLLERTLTKQLANAPRSDWIVEAAVEIVLRWRGCVSIGQITAALGISGRQLERKFSVWVGICPKMFCRIIRFQHIFHAVEQQDVRRWAEVALACNYYDQAHLIKEFKEFSGQTPPSCFVEENSLAHYFTRAHRMSHSYKTGKSSPPRF